MIQHSRAEQTVARVRGGNLQRLRRRICVRDGWLCQCPECQAGYPLKVTLATAEIDHILPLYQGGTNDDANLRTLHRDCHARVTAGQTAERKLAPGLWTDALPA